MIADVIRVWDNEQNFVADRIRKGQFGVAQDSQKIIGRIPDGLPNAGSYISLGGGNLSDMYLRLTGGRLTGKLCVGPHIKNSNELDSVLTAESQVETTSQVILNPIIYFNSIEKWVATHTYQRYGRVLYEGNIFASRINDNRNKNPILFPESWEILPDISSEQTRTNSGLAFGAFEHTNYNNRSIGCGGWIQTLSMWSEDSLSWPDTYSIKNVETLGSGPRNTGPALNINPFGGRTNNWGPLSVIKDWPMGGPNVSDNRYPTLILRSRSNETVDANMSGLSFWTHQAGLLGRWVDIGGAILSSPTKIDPSDPSDRREMLFLNPTASSQGAVCIGGLNHGGNITGRLIIGDWILEATTEASPSRKSTLKIHQLHAVTPPAQSVDSMQNAIFFTVDMCMPPPLSFSNSQESLQIEDNTITAIFKYDKTVFQEGETFEDVQYRYWETKDRPGGKPNGIDDSQWPTKWKTSKDTDVDDINNKVTIIMDKIIDFEENVFYTFEFRITYQTSDGSTRYSRVYETQTALNV